MASPANSPVVRTLNVLIRLAFAATIILIPFRLRILLLSRPFPPVWQDYTDYLLFASDVALIVTVAAWLIRVRLAGEKISIAPKFISYLLIVLTGISALSSITSVDVGLSAYHALRLCILFGLFLFIINEVNDLSDISIPIAIQVFIQAVVSIWQVEMQSSVGLQSVGEYSLRPEWNGVSIVLTETQRFLRAYGLSDHPNILGGCFAFALILLLVFISTKKPKFVYWIVFALGTIGLFYTFSRSAWLGAMFGFVLCLWLLHRSTDKAVFRRAIFVLLFAVVLILPFVLRRVEFLGIRLGAGGAFQENLSEIGSIGERSYLMWAGNELFEKHPVTGVGLGAMPSAFRVEFPNFLVSYQPSHFVILESAAETGLLGATVFLILLVAPWVILWRKRNMPLSSGLIAASGLLLAITVVGFLDYYPWLLNPGRLWLWLGWGLWARFSLTPAKA